MDYQFENLGDERFQEFCHTLISKEFANTKAFPVGQPDGGRDSLSYFMDSPNKAFIVFQVKFVRKPKQTMDIRKWLIDSIEGEIDKINTLIPKGARQYYLLTNVDGTAHLDSGSIDKLNKILESKIAIPALCYWREDLSRLAEKDPLFKWSFPEILNGQDVLNSVLFQNLNENKERRESVIKSYLKDQYELDKEVKFRQIDLQSRLLDLYTDVPISLKKFNEKNRQLKYTLNALQRNQRKLLSSDDTYNLEAKSMGAAEFLLHPKVQTDIQRILLEGGPGQGKSTISQYICQVHRARLLENTIDLSSVPEHIKSTPIRLPFKIDLRHIATWIEKKNPYQGILNDTYFDKIWKNSLEAFILGHIVYHSQLEEFSPGDFVAISKVSPILFVFDGFDEIANIKLRSEVIEFINKGINRISAYCQSIQIIITSRPAAFSDTIGFSVDIYPHFELTDINTNIINEYVSKWIKVSKLTSRESAEIKKLVDEKLKLPHLKELAKSPMQLAIFISLLRTRGESLPNKRTALYDSYIELFFNRESEKNALIRDKRDLIIDIHQYLAWILHSEAELYKNNGSIQIDELKKRLKEYLITEGHETDITEKLFDVMNERVCALVSRVQGTFEFEVQPLREYFCAKYLYNTSPHSPAGYEKSGSKPDRFEAISRNSYWQNVTRFFAGCFGKGELPMLIQKLKELQDDEFLKYTIYPRILTAQILSDYVFTQYPLLLKDVVKLIVDGINLGNIINQGNNSSNGEPILLPIECGRSEVFNECFMQLTKFPKLEYASELIGIINNNPVNTVEKWTEYLSKFKGEKLTVWLEYAYLLQIIHKLDDKLLIKIINAGDINEKSKRIQVLIKGNKSNIFENNNELKLLVLKQSLNGEFFIPARKQIECSWQFVALIFHPWILSHVVNMKRENVPFLQYLSNIFNHSLHLTPKPSWEEISNFKLIHDVDKKIKYFAESIKDLMEIEVSVFYEKIEPWELLVENGRLYLGEQWLFHIISVIAAGIKSKDEISEEYYNLNNSDLTLCKRARYARMRSGNTKYWTSQLQSSQNNKYVLLVLFTWGTPKSIDALMPQLSIAIDKLNSYDFLLLASALRITTSNSSFNRSQQKYIRDLPNKKEISDRIKFILSIRFNDQNGELFVYKNIQKFTGVLENALEVKLNHLISVFISKPSDLVVLDEIKNTYKNIKYYKLNNYYSHKHSIIKIPYEIAKLIMSESKHFPKIISSFAEKSCRIYSHEHSKPVGKIAKKDGWFDD